MSRYATAVEQLGQQPPRWWRRGDRTLDRLRREQRREAWARQRYSADDLARAMHRRLDPKAAR